MYDVKNNEKNIITHRYTLNQNFEHNFIKSIQHYLKKHYFETFYVSEFGSVHSTIVKGLHFSLSEWSN